MHVFIYIYEYMYIIHVYINIYIYSYVYIYICGSDPIWSATPSCSPPRTTGPIGSPPTLHLRPPVVASQVN